PEYNGVKFFDRDGQKLTDEGEEEIEALLDAPFEGEPGTLDHVGVATDSYLEHIVERFGSDLSGLKIVVDCANGAYSGIAPKAFEQLGASVTAIGSEPDGTNINRGCGATDLGALQQAVTKSGADLGIAFDGDGDRMLAVDGRGEMVDGDQILAILMLHLGVELVAVTVMTNLGFQRLAEEHGIRVVTTAVGGRSVLEALRRAAGLLLCGALEGRSLEAAAAVIPRYPQAKANLRVRSQELPQSVLEAVERLNDELDGSGRVLVRPSGTEPLVRVLAEAETSQKA